MKLRWTYLIVIIDVTVLAVAGGSLLARWMDHVMPGSTTMAQNTALCLCALATGQTLLTWLFFRRRSEI